MACMAAVAGASVATVAACSTSAGARGGSRGGGAASATPLALRRSFNGGALSTSSNARRSGSLRFEPLVVRATSSEEAPPNDPAKQLDEWIAEAKAKWETVENKSTVAIYAGGALVTLWLSSTIIGAVNSVPLLPKLLELVGLGYTGWFVYRYLLFKSSRKELVSDIEELKGKITGATSGITGSSGTTGSSGMGSTGLGSTKIDEPL